MSVCFMCVQMSVSARARAWVCETEVSAVFLAPSFLLEARALTECAVGWRMSSTVFIPTENEASRKARHIYTFTGVLGIWTQALMLTWWVLNDRDISLSLLISF